MLLQSKKKKIEQYLKDRNGDLAGFDELLVDFLNRSPKSLFTELGMTKLEINITWLKEYKCIDLQGRYNGNYVDIQIDEAR